MTKRLRHSWSVGYFKPIAGLLALALIVKQQACTDAGEGNQVLQVFSNAKVIADNVAGRVKDIETSVQTLETELKNLDPKQDKRKTNKAKQALGATCQRIRASSLELSQYGGIKSGDSGYSPQDQDRFYEAAKALPLIVDKTAEALKSDRWNEVSVQVGALQKAVADGKPFWLKKGATPIAAGPYLVGSPTTVGPFESSRFVDTNVFYVGNKAIQSTLDLGSTTAFFPRGAAFEFGPAGEPFPEVWGRRYIPYVVKRSLTAQPAAPPVQADPDGKDEPKKEAPKIDRVKRLAEVKEIFDKRGVSKDDIDDLDVVGDSVVPQVRWHLYCQKPGKIKMALYLAASAEDAKAPWVVQIAQGPQVDDVQSCKQEKESQRVRIVESDGEKPQPHVLTFQVKKPGRVSIYLNQDAMPDASGKLFFIRCTGPAMENALILNAKSNPFALYATFVAPKECPAPLFWVMETKVIGGNVAFCPAVTPFGYFGKLFYGSYVEPDESRLHWSMWSKKKGTPRIVASSNPALRGSINSNEGTTVRGVWNVCSSPERSVVQALRATREPDGGTTYYGYVYDSAEKRWKLYVAGQQGFPRKTPDSQSPFEEKSTNGGIGVVKTFVEVITRRVPTGDAPRAIYRRVWFYGSDEKFYPARLVHEGNVVAPDADADGEPIEKLAKGATNCGVFKTKSYETDGWAVCLTGGVAHYKQKPAANAAADLDKRVRPEYLSPQRAREIFSIPVTFNGRRATEIKGTSATIEYDIADTGPNAKAVLFYGEGDSNAHVRPKENEPAPPKPGEPLPPQKNGRFSNDGTRAAAKAIQESGWNLNTPERELKAGKNRFELSGLKPETTYFYRVRITNDHGMSWDYVSGYFKTAVSEKDVRQP